MTCESYAAKYGLRSVSCLPSAPPGKERPRFAGLSQEPSAGLEPATPSLPSRTFPLFAGSVRYAGLRPQEALALEWRHVRERTLLVERALSDGQLKALKNRRQPRTVELLAPLREDLAAWRAAQGEPPATAPVFPSHAGTFWRASDWRNWRKRSYKPVAEAVGITARAHTTCATRSRRC